MKIQIFVLAFLLCSIAKCEIKDLAEDESPETKMERYLRVVTNLKTKQSKENENRIKRLAKAYQVLKKKPSGDKLKKNRQLIPILDSVLGATGTAGRIIDYPLKAMGASIVNSPKEEASLGIGATMAASGGVSMYYRNKEYETLHRALQKKYKVNGFYLASLEDENLELRYFTKRLKKISDKAKRHREDMLSKLHFTSF